MLQSVSLVKRVLLLSSNTAPFNLPQSLCGTRPDMLSLVRYTGLETVLKRKLKLARID